MKQNKDYHTIRKIVVGELQTTIKAHGPITSRFIGSAAKRIAGMINGWHHKKRSSKKVESHH